MVRVQSLMMTLPVLAFGVAGVAFAQAGKKPAHVPSKTATTPAAASTKSNASGAAATKATPSTTAAKAGAGATAAPVAVSGAQGAVGPTAALPRVYAPTRTRQVTPRYPWKEKIPTTIFWIGEAPSQNNPTPNNKSSWDPNWEENYGGYDDPNPAARSWNFTPKGFVPKQNPFYVALPFNDVTNRQMAKAKIPWHDKKWNGTALHSVCRSRWVAVRYGNKVCLAQWEDCGPWNTDDHDYVFGNKRPKNLENDGAGLDVSPAVRDYLGIMSGALCDWRFVDEDEVPDGPWKRMGTNNPFVKTEEQRKKEFIAEYERLVKLRDQYLQGVDPSQLRRSN